MSQERLGAERTFTMGDLRFVVRAIYPNEDPDASPAYFSVEVWTRSVNQLMDLKNVRELLGVFGGTSNDW